MALVRMRVLPTMPEPARKRMAYRTRMLMADGDEFDVGSSDAVALRKMKWAEEVPPAAVAPAAATPRRGRPPRTAPPPPPEPEALEEKTVAELREMAEDRGVELPSRYVRKDELAELVSQADEDDGA